MIKVCDAIMGSGKSSAAITYLNEHPNDRFIYITPYLDEAKRIRDSCPDLHFVEPSNRYEAFKHTKYLHTMALIENGENITTTHEAFKRYTQETLDYIKEQGYTLIIDENVNILETLQLPSDDLKLALDAGYIREENGEYFIVNEDYHGAALADIYRTLRSQRLLRVGSGENNNMFFWTLPQELITAFKDVYILTYLFEGQGLYYLLKMYGLNYIKIGIEHNEDGVYRFCDHRSYIPGYVSKLKDMIEILDNEKMNDIGDEKFDLSMSWYAGRTKDIQQMKRNMINYFNNICKDVSSNEKLWGCFEKAKNKISGKGYTKSYLNFGTKATNSYRHKTCLAYPVNIFMNANDKRFYLANGAKVNEDIYALSIMVQWIWRSAIREGKKIKLYLPSKRMRSLLVRWIEITSKGGEIDGNVM